MAHDFNNLLKAAWHPLAMCCRLVCGPLLFVLAALVPACGNSTASDRRDGAVPANDSSPGEDAQSEVTVPDGWSPDGVVRADTMDAAAAEGDASQDRADGAGTAADGSLAAFCTGTATRTILNGYSGAPVVRISSIATGCCDGFALELNSATYASPIFVTATVSGASLAPVDIDLGNPPQDWKFSVSSDCETTSPSSCKERYDSGFVGTFRTARVEDSTAIDLSLCLHVEDVDGSHRLLQTLDLSIPHAIAK